MTLLKRAATAPAGVMAGAAVGYMALVTALMLRNGLVATPDYVVVLMAPVALVSGRGIAWLRDWVPFIALLLLWEGMRSLAGRYALTGVHWGNLPLERLLFAGRLPSVALQHAVASAGLQHAVDTAAAIVDLSHFPATLTLALLIWLRGREAFLGYSLSLFGTAFSAFVIFLLMPTAPPWYAALHGQVDGLRHVMAQVMPVRWSAYYTSLDPNPVAADPSLHAALPFLGFLALRRLRSPLAWPALAWCFAVWLSVVYLGEHYVLDVVTGVALAALWAALAARLLPATGRSRNLTSGAREYSLQQVPNKEPLT